MDDHSSSSISKFAWWVRDDVDLSGVQSPRPSLIHSEQYSRSDSLVTLPITGTMTPMTPLTRSCSTQAKTPKISGEASPEVRQKLDNASPETARHIALRMYESLKKHGLKDEAGKALQKDDQDEYQLEVIEEESVDGVRKKSTTDQEELLGMDYLLKDGFVSYLRDMARITPPIPQQAVRFSNISYTKKFKVTDNEYETFGSKLVGCFVEPLKTLVGTKKSTWVQILKGVDGYIMPGSMTLLLGPPGSGKSALLEILAGRVKEGNKNSILKGAVMYNDKDASDICRSRLIAYISSQLNNHIPFLSVRETLEFAKDCTQGLRLETYTPQMRKFFAHALVEGQDPLLEYVIEILSLKKIEHKLTGEGISDADREKLTTAELALGTYSVMLYDQPLSGSDLAATYDLVDTIRTISRIQQSSAIMSLTQLSEEVFNLFDRVILLRDGHVLFQGPRQDAIPHFTNLGYIKPPHIESSEFLEDIAARDGSQYVAPGAISYTLEELVEWYRASDHYKDIMRIVHADEVKLTYWVESAAGLGLSLKTSSKNYCSIDANPRRETELVVSKLSSKVGHSGGIERTERVQVGDVVRAISTDNNAIQYLSVGSEKIQRERTSHAYFMFKKARGRICLQVERYKEEEDYQAQWEQFQRPFVQTWWKSTKTLIKRQIKITKRLHALIKLRLLQAIVLGLFAGTLFYKLGGKYDQQKMNSIRALGFVSTMSIMLINLVQLPLYMLQRPIFYKHRNRRFFRTSSYIVAHCIVNLPQTLIEALAYTLSVYFLAGLSLSGNGAPFFEYLVLLFLVAYFGSSVFFLLSAISSIPEVGNALAGLLVSILLLFSGFVIYPTNIPTYWKWLTYVNPIHWANVSFCRIQFNEDYREPCSNYLSQLSFCDQFHTMTVGNAYLAFHELSEDAERPWLPYVILLGWIAIANLLTLLGLKNTDFSGMSPSLPHPKTNTTINNYKIDTESGFQLNSSNKEQSDDYGYTRHCGPEMSRKGYDKMKNDGGVDRWIQEFRVDLERNGLGIPLKPVTLLFEDLSFTRYEEGTKESSSVFKYVTGYARPRNMLALLGGSKRSKTTLLKCLAGRIPQTGSFRGNLQANGISISAAFYRFIGYVEKLDAHQPYLSVRESLQFSAALRLDQEISPISRQIHVEQVLNQLGLLPYSNKLVGSLRDATGKTFEIAKRITIAVELAANPSLILLEEPISDLDTAGTLSILRILSQVSDSGRVIIASLSYPNARTLPFFDQVLILTGEGNQAYFGPIGSKCHKLLAYFTSIPKAPLYSRRESPVQFVMGALGAGIKKRGIPSLNFVEIYQTSSLHEVHNKEIINIKKLKNREMEDKSSSYPAPYSHQALLVLLRTQRFLWRNVQYTYGRLTGCVMIGLLMGSLYFQIGYKDIYSVTSRALYIYMQVILIGVISASNVIPQLGTDRLVYLREKRAQMYLPIFYPISWAIGEIPYFLFATLAVVAIGNGMAGIGTGSAIEFLIYWIVLFIFTLSVTYFGMMITFLSPVQPLAAVSVSIVTSLWVSASGVVVVLSDIKFYQWMYWSNPFQYAVNALTSISFYCDTKDCRSDCKCPQFPDGSSVWDRLATVRSLSHERIGIDILILTAMSMLFASLAIVFFVVLKHNSPTQM